MPGSAAGSAVLPVPKGEKPTQGERSNLFAAWKHNSNKHRGTGTLVYRRNELDSLSMVG